MVGLGMSFVQSCTNLIQEWKQAVGGCTYLKVELGRDILALKQNTHSLSSDSHRIDNNL